MAEIKDQGGTGMSGKDEQVTPEKAPVRKKKKLFVMIGALLLLLAIAAGAIVYLRSGKNASPEEAKAENGEKAEKRSAESVYPLEPFIVNIYDSHEIRYLKLKVEFETAGKEAKEEMDAAKAPLRDAILVLLTTKTFQDIQDLRGKNRLREEILAAINKIIPPGKVTKVYFTDFVVQ